MVYSDETPYAVTISGEAAEPPALEDIAVWLRHIVYLHDRLVLITSKRYDYAVSSFRFFPRSGNRLGRNELLVVRSLRHGSPLEVGIVIASAIAVPAAAKALVELIKLVRDWKPDNEYKKLRNIDLYLDIQRKMQELDIPTEIPENLLGERPKEQPADAVAEDVRRLLKDAVAIKDIKVTETTKGKG